MVSAEVKMKKKKNKLIQSGGGLQQTHPAGPQVYVPPPSPKGIRNLNKRSKKKSLTTHSAQQQDNHTISNPNTNDDLVRSYYLDPTKPGSFGGVYGLLKNSKLS